MNGGILMESTFILRYLGMFRFQGWFFHDLTLGIVYGLTFLFGIALFRMMFRRKKPKKIRYSYEKFEKEAVFSFPSLISFCLTLLFFFLIVSNFGLFVFGGGMTRNELLVDSGGFLVDNLVIAKWRRNVNNGTSNGGANSAHFQLSGLDVKKGEIHWNRRSNWHEKLIGQTSEGIILLQIEKGQISLFNSQTGKDECQHKEFEAIFPSMKNNWSKLEKDYLVSGDNYLYTYGLDGQYYQLDLKNKGIVKDPTFEQLFLKRQTFAQVENQNVEELEKATGESFFNSEILTIQDQEWYFIAHSETRKPDSQVILSAVSRNNPQIKWQRPLGISFGSETSVQAISIEGRFYYATNGFSFVITKENGDLNLMFDHLSNHSLQVVP